MNYSYLKSLRIVYFALAAGIVFFMLVSLLIHSISGPLAKTDISPAERAPFLIILVVLTGATFIVYKSVFAKKLEAVKALPTLERKLAAWRELCILRGALIEAPAFFAIVLFMLLGVYAVLVWPLTGIALFWFSQPTLNRFISETNLSPGEIAEFDKME